MQGEQTFRDWVFDPREVAMQRASRVILIAIAGTVGALLAVYSYGLEIAVGVSSAPLARASLALDSDARRPSKSILIKAVRHNNHELVEVLIRSGAPMDKACRYGSALHAAVSSKSEDALKALIRLGADTSVRDAWGSTALHVASESGNTKSLAVLITAGADVNARDFKGQTPLHGASSTESLRALVARGGDINAKDHAGKTPLHAWAGPRPAEPGMIRTAIQLGADPTLQDTYGSTPSALARAAGNQDALGELERGSGGR